jgi:hypothetical protein
MPERFRNLHPGILIGKPIDDPDVLDFLRIRYPWHLKLARRWVKCGKAAIVRYEELCAAPLESLARRSCRGTTGPGYAAG